MQTPPMQSVKMAALANGCQEKYPAMPNDVGANRDAVEIKACT